jgi:hypothetical protein
VRSFEGLTDQQLDQLGDLLDAALGPRPAEV